MPEPAILPALCGIPVSRIMDTMEQQEPNALRRCREGHGYTQVMLGRLLGLKDGSWVSRWEHGEALPSLESAIKLSILLDMPIPNLFPAMAEKAGASVREQSMVISSMSEVPGLSEDSQQSEEVPQD